MLTGTHIDSLVRSYATQLVSYDEMLTADRNVRAHWLDIFTRIASMGSDGLEKRHLEIERLLRENGVTYSIYGDPYGLNRAWKMDPVPFLLQANDWYEIEKGLKQRAALLNLVLTDIYTDRKLLKKGLLPPEMVFAHAGFLRQCDQVLLRGKHQLLIYGADMARGPDGRMWVLNDRTQAPSGTGYALENRFTMRRVLPDLFQEMPVRRLAYFFNTIRNSFPKVSNKTDPNIVILTPGPSNETFFEHSFLASYLGYTLAQGEDLTVRNNKVWLKTMGGLEPVDIIIRRVDDTFCDPLEFRSDSKLGIAGLLQAARSGNVVIANPLGSGVLENPGLLAFLPNICKYFLNEELVLPSAATWWCGQPKELDYVLANLDKLVIKSIQPQLGSTSVFGSTLSRMKLDNWRKRIKENPHLFVGQEQVEFSTSPCYINGQIQPRYSVTRGFVVANDHDYEVMPGGLTRNSPEKGNLFVSNQAGGTSKDTWVLIPDLDQPVSIQTRPNADVKYKGLDSMPSRTAENLFWVGRYAERSKGMARLIRTVLTHIQETTKSDQALDKQVNNILLTAITQVTMTYPGFLGKEGTQKLKKPDNELLAVTTELNKSGSLTSTIQFLLNASFAVRDRWSSDTLRIIEAIKGNQHALLTHQDLKLRDLQNILDQFITSLAAFTSFTRESLSQEQGWLVFDAGRRIERILQLIYLLRATLTTKTPEPVEYYLMEAVLTTKESLSTYRYQYRTQLLIENVLDLLLFDQSHPSSLTYQLVRLKSYATKLPVRNPEESYRLQQIMEKTFEVLSEYPMKALCETKENDFLRENLDQVLYQISDLIFETSNIIVSHYFSHLNYSRQLVAELEK